MRTAFTSWKLAKGLYIIPIVMAYRPLLMNGPFWEVTLTMASTSVGLIAFAACLEKWFLTEATWTEVALLFVGAAGLFWASIWANAVGFVLFLIVILKQKSRRTRASAGGTGAGVSVVLEESAP